MLTILVSVACACKNSNSEYLKSLKNTKLEGSGFNIYIPTD